MFTPEFSVASKGEFVLIANHALGSSDQAARLPVYDLWAGEWRPPEPA